MLSIKNLQVQIEEKSIIQGLDLQLNPGKVHVIMGPNGSGKSTLANTLMGHPKYEVTGGSVEFEQEDVLEMEADERARAGLFLSFQYPNEIPGITISNFLRTAVNAVRGEEKKLSVVEFHRLVKEKMKLLGMKKEFLHRYLNQGFSGGEKKRSEILQLLMLDPKLAILDETDSGLDIDALRAVSEGVNAFMSPQKSVLIITHYKRILEYIKPDKVFIMIEGKIALEGGSELVDQLEEKGYGWITQDE